MVSKTRVGRHDKAVETLGYQWPVSGFILKMELTDLPGEWKKLIPLNYYH
jgi:hypothetical protein